jgi:hypothetical protein
VVVAAAAITVGHTNNLFCFHHSPPNLDKTVTVNNVVGFDPNHAQDLSQLASQFNRLNNLNGW